MNREVHDEYRGWQLNFHHPEGEGWSVHVRRELPGTDQQSAAWVEFDLGTLEEAYAAARGWIDAEYALAAQGLWSSLQRSGDVSAGMAG